MNNWFENSKKLSKVYKELICTVARLLHFWSQIFNSVVKRTMKTKGKYKEKQRALLKVWLQKCSNLATVLICSQSIMLKERHKKR